MDGPKRFKKKKKGVGKREREEGKRTKTKTHHQTVITNQISIPYFWRGDLLETKKKADILYSVLACFIDVTHNRPCITAATAAAQEPVIVGSIIIKIEALTIKIEIKAAKKKSIYK